MALGWELRRFTGVFTSASVKVVLVPDCQIVNRSKGSNRNWPEHVETSTLLA